MEPNPLLYKNLIRLAKDTETPSVYNVEIHQLDKLKQFDCVECHIVLYPYSRNISSKNISFFPFEEYVKDIQSHQRSAYVKLGNPMNNIFGLFLGILITLIFFFLKPDDLYSIESIVSVFGAYIIGKELWTDIERNLINFTKKWRIQYRENYYVYQLEKNTTLTQYSYLAKKQRYGKASLLPEKIDFIEQSNSQTIRMAFDMKDLKNFESASANILFIHVDPHVAKELEKDGFMLGVKLSFNQRFLGIKKVYEIFQSMNNKARGCLDEKGDWREGAIFYRKTFLFGRIKAFWKKGIIKKKYIIFN